jgi:hypothetical protein
MHDKFAVLMKIFAQSTEILGRLRIQPKTVCEESEGPAHLGKHFSIQTSLDSKPWNLCAAR